MTFARILTVTPLPETEREAEIIGRSIGQMKHRYRFEGEARVCQCGHKSDDSDPDLSQHVEKRAQAHGRDAMTARLCGADTWLGFLLANGAVDA